MTPTETALRDWRTGAIGAERLVAGLLTLEGFSGIDPQAPLGGPDGGKDILAGREGSKWVAAVFFPPTTQRFAEVRVKFTEDIAGVRRNRAAGFAFFVNQHLTVGDRAELTKLATDGQGIPPEQLELYHLERLRAILDTPRGYGLRLEHLRIAMTLEEQISFFSELNDELTKQRLAHAVELTNLNRKIDVIVERTAYLVERAGPQRGSSLEPASVHSRVADDLKPPMSELNVSVLALIHRLVTDSDSRSRGHIRGVNVWTKSGSCRCIVGQLGMGIDSTGRDHQGWWTIKGEGSSNSGRDTWVWADKVVRAVGVIVGERDPRFNKAAA